MTSTTRLLLIKPVVADLTRYFEIHSDPATNQFNPGGPLKSREDATKHLLEITDHWVQYGFGPWKIVEKENPEYMIGLGGLDYRKYNDHLKLNLGYRFDKNYWGKGYATELAKGAIAFGFQELGKEEIFGLVRPKHSASIRILEKCGLQKHGELDDVPNGANSLVYKISTSD